MIVINWGNRAAGRVNDIGRIIAAAQPHFDQGDIGGAFREGQIGRSCRGLEKRERRSGISLPHPGQNIYQGFIIYFFTADDDAFSEMNEVRGGIDMGL